MILFYSRMNWLMNRKKTDVIYNLSCSIRRLINNSINRSNYTKISKTCSILGCSYKEFKIHIESKFEEWMDWNNKGLYNIKVCRI